MARLGDWEYPEINLSASIDVARKITREFSGEVSRTGLARSLGMSERGGAFASRLGCDQALGHCYRPEQDSANAGRFAGRTSTFPVRGPICDALPGAVRAAVRGTRQAATAIVAGTGTPRRLRRRDHWRRPDSRWSVCNNYRQGVSRAEAVSGRFRGAIRHVRRSPP